MPGRIVPLVNGEIYHIFNRGSDMRDIFLQTRDYRRFKQTFFYYQFLGPKPRFSNLTKYKISNFNPLSNDKWVDTLCYCLMPNHFHFLTRQLKEKGIATFISQLSNSYTKYFNTKYKRIGALFQGVFKAVRIETDEQLIHTSRYIHLNPVVADVSKKLELYPWSSYSEYTRPLTTGLCSVNEILSLFPSREKYQEFINDQIDYARSLEIIKHQLLDEF